MKNIKGTLIKKGNFNEVMVNNEHYKDILPLISRELEFEIYQRPYIIYNFYDTGHVFNYFHVRDIKTNEAILFYCTDINDESIHNISKKKLTNFINKLEALN